MTFKTFQLIINNNFPHKLDISNIISLGPKIYRHKVYLYKVSNYMLEDRFWFMSCSYDNAMAYNNTVWNETEKMEEENPRKKPQIECRKQLFVCYDCKTYLLYMSDMSQRGFLKKYLLESLNQSIQIKNIFKSIEDFESSVKDITKSKFIQSRNLMNTTPGSIFERVANIYGLDAPEKISITVECGNTPISKVKKQLRHLKNKKDLGEFDSIIFIGEDDQGIEQSFDFSSMIQSLPINVEKDENEHYDSETVKKLLVEKIR